MTTMTPKFETTSRHRALGFAVIASLWISSRSFPYSSE